MPDQTEAMPMKCKLCSSDLVSATERSRGICAPCFILHSDRAEMRTKDDTRPLVSRAVDERSEPGADGCREKDDP